MTARKNKTRLVPEVEQALELLKMDIARELGLVDGSSGSTLESALEKYKHEIACELGIDSFVKQKGWQNASSDMCGAVGSRMGGRIGGNMVKQMIEMAEKELAGIE